MRVRDILQVNKELSSTGFVRILAKDTSSPHPSSSVEHWNYIVMEYDPKNPDKKGREKRIKADRLLSAIARNEVTAPSPP